MRPTAPRKVATSFRQPENQSGVERPCGRPTARIRPSRLLPAPIRPRSAIKPRCTSSSTENRSLETLHHFTMMKTAVSSTHWRYASLPLERPNERRAVATAESTSDADRSGEDHGLPPVGRQSTWQSQGSFFPELRVQRNSLGGAWGKH